MSNTPRTDALIAKHNKFGDYPWAELCKDLESQLAAEQQRARDAAGVALEMAARICRKYADKWSSKGESVYPLDVCEEEIRAHIAQPEAVAAVIDGFDILLRLVELKRIKRRIETEDASNSERKYYESMKEQAWTDAENTIDRSRAP